ERWTLLRVTALVMAFAGLASLFGAGGMSANMANLPGVLLALTGSVGFAVGTIFLKRYPIQLPGATSATWQIAIGSVPIALAGTLLEHPHIAALSSAGWFALGYMILVGHCIAYVTWFGAVERLPASVAAIGTMLVPVIGVVVSAIALHEPLGLSQIAALPTAQPGAESPPSCPAQSFSRHSGDGARRPGGLHHPRQERSQQRRRGHGTDRGHHREPRQPGSRGDHRLRRVSWHRPAQDRGRLAPAEFRPVGGATRVDHARPHPQPGATGAGIQAG